MEAHRYRFGVFEFDSGSGELRRGEQSAERLPPQPARLLTLLLDRRGELLTREEIREAIWPEVQVDFDTSLHYCIRQIRAALGDSATGPGYIETLPRRGYRWTAGVERVEVEVAKPVPSSRRSPLPAVVVLVAVAAIALLAIIPGSGPQGEPPLRIGVMPFEAPEGLAGFGDTGPIAEWILEDLTTTTGRNAEIVGPTTTSDYAASDATLRQLAADYDLDYVVNGRFLDNEGKRRMLAELIRTSDGAHIWVRGYEELGDTRRIGLEISGIVIAELGVGN